MDVFALIVACSVYPDQAVVRAVVELASRGNPNFVGDLSTFDTYDSVASRHQGERLVTALERRGGRPLVGLMGLPPAWAQRYARTRSDLFDPCVNLWIGTAVLSGHHDACVAAHAAIFMSDGLAASSPGTATTAPTAAARTPPASRAWASVTPALPASPPASRALPPTALETISPASSTRACALSRFASELGVAGYTDAVMNLVPQQRRLFALPDPGASYVPDRRATSDAGTRRRGEGGYVRDSRFPVLNPAPRPPPPPRPAVVPGPTAIPETAPILD